ncbi:MAG: restriction endonuclease [Ruminococcaceae bacterium]|nr:restriction endonuclease [Oscillospiraceae bacterium]
MIIPKNLDDRILDAVCYFWRTRSRQNQSGGVNSPDYGNRGAVTGGKQLDGFVNLIAEILEENNVPTSSIFKDSNLELPGFYRPNKKWDLLIVDQNVLVAAVEFKSQVGPSFGNNFNNRTEEAMGSALDIWTAYREGVFGKQPPPWLGYFMVLEEEARSSVPVRVRSPHFEILPEFSDTSYIDRYQLFCQKLILERLYSSACLMTTQRESQGEIWFGYPDEELSLYGFVSSLLGAVLSHLSRKR